MLRSETREQPAPGAARETGFQPRDLSRICYGNGFTLWHYRSHRHRVDDLLAPGYFADAYSSIMAEDVLFLIGVDGATIGLVSAVDVGVVSVVPFCIGGQNVKSG